MSQPSPGQSRPVVPSWRHRLLVRYFRAREHPGRLRLLGWLKRLLRVQLIRCEVVPGVVMDLDENDYVQREILLFGGYEKATLARFDALLREARGVVDFGAHMGLYSLRAARALAPAGGRVFAVEPTPTHAAALLHNAALSGLVNLTLCTSAVSAAPALLRMVAPHSANTGGSRLADTTSLPDLRSIPLLVPVRPAAELAPLVPPECLDVVKIDVEGHEFDILRSFLPALPRRPHDILLEFKPSEFDYGPVADTTGWLRSLGYELRAIDGTPYNQDRPLPEDNLWAHHRA